MLLIAVDLDNTIASGEASSDPFKIGDPLPGAVEFMNNLSSKHRLMIYTARINEDWSIYAPGYTIAKAVETIHDWLEEHGMPLCEIWTGRGKPIVNRFLDDRALTCTPENYTELLTQLGAL